jgi:hypothetical protein
MLRRFIALPLAALIVIPTLSRGEEKAATSTEGANAETSGPRGTSREMTRNIALKLPKFEPKSVAAESTNGTVAGNASTHVLVLPEYVVRDKRPIPQNDVMTDQAREDAIVKRYAGTPSDLDVALNKFTFNTLWKKIPFIGTHSDFASMTYKQRVVEDYKKIEAKRKYQEALGVSADVPPSKATSDADKK